MVSPEQDGPYAKYWAQIDDVLKGFERTPEEIEEYIRLIKKEPKLEALRLQEWATAVTEEIQGLADVSPEYRAEHYDAERRHRELGESFPDHTYTITQGGYRIRIFSTGTVVRNRTISLSLRPVERHLTNAEHRLHEEQNVANQGLWIYKATVRSGRIGNDAARFGIEYEGPDPYGDESLGRLPSIVDTERAAAGLDLMVGKWREERSPTNLDRYNW